MADVVAETMVDLKMDEGDFPPMAKSYTSDSVRGFGLYIPYICVGGSGWELTLSAKHAPVAQED